MRVVVQRVSQAAVNIEGICHSRVQKGLLILLGIENADGEEDINWLVTKLLNLRIFADTKNRMNLSIQDIKGELLIISQFTLHADTKKGNRPSFINAAKPEVAIPLYEHFIDDMGKRSGLKVYSGVFGADMQVTLTNDGPVTIIIDTKHKE